MTAFFMESFSILIQYNVRHDFAKVMTVSKILTRQFLELGIFSLLDFEDVSSQFKSHF